MSRAKALWGKLTQRQIGAWSLADPRDRLLVSAGASFLLDLFYALYHGALGVRDGSLWFLTLCAYYSLLGAVRFGAVACGRKGRPHPATETFVTGLSGALLILLSVVLAGVSGLSLAYGIAVRRDTIMMITIATYTFAKLGMAAARAVRWRGDPSRLLAVVRVVGYAELAASVFTMQRSMIVSFGGMEENGMRVLNMLSGAAVFLFVLTLGVSLVCKAKKGANPNGKIKTGTGE